MSAEPPRRDWRIPPTRHPGLAPEQGQRRDTPLGALAVACFLLAIFLLAIVVPELR